MAELLGAPLLVLSSGTPVLETGLSLCRERGFPGSPLRSRACCSGREQHMADAFLWLCLSEGAICVGDLPVTELLETYSCLLQQDPALSISAHWMLLLQRSRCPSLCSCLFWWLPDSGPHWSQTASGRVKSL